MLTAVDSLRDIEVINTELVLPTFRRWKTGFRVLTRQIGDKKPAAARYGKETVTISTQAASHSFSERRLMISGAHERDKLIYEPVIYAANVDEDGLGEDNEYVKAVTSLRRAPCRGCEDLCENRGGNGRAMKRVNFSLRLASLKAASIR
jgi:ribosome-binding ATPase YchF (GTP1/OBG family)